MSLLSSKLGFPIYVPSLFHGLVYLFKFIFGGNPTAGCSPKKESEESPCPSPNPSPKSWLESIKSFFGKGKPLSVSEEDICKKLKKDLQIGLFDLNNVKSKVVKGRKIEYRAFGFFWNKNFACTGFKATADELKDANILRDAKKK